MKNSMLETSPKSNHLFHVPFMKEEFHKNPPRHKFARNLIAEHIYTDSQESQRYLITSKLQWGKQSMQTSEFIALTPDMQIAFLNE